jgi:hypothetical protein
MAARGFTNKGNPYPAMSVRGMTDANVEQHSKRPDKFRFRKAAASLVPTTED